ncbi:MAG: ABC transporter permease, partial [Bacteroidetes bacterium]|nr:ABC transporter permease [Bacteroidota bacterium]
MNFQDYLKLAINALKGNRLRSILTLLIISFGIMALIIIFTCIDAIRGNITENFIDLGASAFTIQKDDGLNKRRSNSELANISYSEAELFEKKYKFPSQLAMHAKVSDNVIVKSKFLESNPNVSIESGSINYLEVAGKSILKGRAFTELEMQSASNVAIVGFDLASKLYPSIDSVVGSKIMLDGKRYSVIGLLESKGASAGKND